MSQTQARRRPARRTSGLRGKRRAKPTNLPYLHTLATGDRVNTTSVPSTGDITNGWTNWAGMLGNGPDKTLTLNRGKPVGDCFWAAFMRGLIIKALIQVSGKWVLRPGFTMPTSDQTVGLYFGWGSGKKPGVSATSGPDKGTDCEDALQWLLEAGMIKRYGPVAKTRAARLEAVTTHKGVITGVMLDEDAEDEFAERKVWKAFPQSVDPDIGGHAIYDVAWTETLDTYLTWGAKQKAQAKWSDDEIDELWWFQAPWEDDADGYDFTDLDAALEAKRAARAAAAAAPSKLAKVRSFIGHLVAQIPTVLTEAAKLQNPALDTTIASGAIAIAVAIFGNVHLTVAEVAGWLAVTGTVAAAAERLIPAPVGKAPRTGTVIGHAVLELAVIPSDELNARIDARIAEHAHHSARAAKRQLSPQ
jgi:hypothetical protein